MIGIYFSGTGNTKYCVEKFMREWDPAGKTVSIEEENAVRELRAHEDVVLGYPVQFSTPPKILQDFILRDPSLWRGKRIFILATMALFSGDGAGVLARLLRRQGAQITGGLHLKMPDSIGDVRALKRTPAQNQALVRRAGRKIERAVQDLKRGRPPREGLSFGSRLAGFFGQRLYFSYQTRTYSNKLRIDAAKCTRCGRCAAICPMDNLSRRDGAITPEGRCTMCYRCISLCPARAITLLGKRVYEQGRLENYL